MANGGPTQDVFSASPSCTQEGIEITEEHPKVQLGHHHEPLMHRCPIGLKHRRFLNRLHVQSVRQPRPTLELLVYQRFGEVCPTSLPKQGDPSILLQLARAKRF